MVSAACILNRGYVITNYTHIIENSIMVNKFLDPLVRLLYHLKHVIVIYTFEDFLRLIMVCKKYIKLDLIL